MRGIKIYDINCKYTAQFLRERPPEDLQQMLIEAKLARLTINTMAQTEKVSSDLFGKVKRDIARIKTVLREIQ